MRPPFDYPFTVYLDSAIFVGNIVLKLLFLFGLFSLFLLYYKLFTILFKLTFRQAKEYKIKVNTLKDFYKSIFKFFLVLLVILLLYSLRKWRIKYIASFHTFSDYAYWLKSAYYLKSSLHLFFQVTLIVIIVLLILLLRLCLTLVTYRIKTLCISLHVLFLQLARYKVWGNRLLKIHDYYFICYSNLLSKFFSWEIARYGIDIYKFTVMLENVIFRYFMYYCYVFDILTNYGFICLFYTLGPYYFLYAVIRTTIITLYTWFYDYVYLELSESFYDGFPYQFTYHSINY